MLVPEVLSDELISLHGELLKLGNVRLFAEAEEAAILRQAKSLHFSHIIQLRRNLVRIKTLSGRQFDCPIAGVSGVLERGSEEGSDLNAFQSSAVPETPCETDASFEQEFHFLLSGAKHQRTLLREKASKALSLLKDATVLIHEIPRDLLLAALDGKNTLVTGWKDAEERELALKLPTTIKKLMEGKKGSLLVFYNHRDSTIMNKYLK